MTGELLLLLFALGQAPRAVPGDSLRALALAGSDEALSRAVRDAPVAARDAIPLLLASATQLDSASEQSLQAAGRLADVIAGEWGDSFPRLQVDRFAAWGPAGRRQKVIVDSLRRAGNAALGRRGLGVAMPLWRRSVRLAWALGDTAGAAAALGNIGTGFYRAGELDSASTYYARATTLSTQVRDFRTALNAMGGAATVALERGQLREARMRYDSTVSLRAAIGDVRGLAADQINIGTLDERLGDIDGARAAYLEALALSDRYGMAEPAAVSLVNLGSLAALRADFPEAESRYAAALTRYDSLENPSGRALVLHHLGLLALQRGDYEQAAQQLRSSLAIYVRTGPDLSAIQVRIDLARALSAGGDLDLARSAIEQARTSSAAAGDIAAATTELAAADLAVDFNSYDEADRSYRKAEQLYRVAGDAVGRAQARQGLAYLLLLRGDAPSAVTMLKLAVAALDLAGEHREAAVARLDLSYAYTLTARPIRARSTLQAAYDTLRRVGDLPGTAAALHGMAELERQGGRPAAAAVLYQEGLDVLAGHRAPAVAWQLHAGLAEALADQKATAAAAAAMRQAVDILDSTALRIPAEQRRARFFADKWDAYDQLARLEQQLGRDSSAFEVSERLRAGEMRDALARGRIPWRGGDSALVREEQELRHAIAEIGARLEAPPAAAGTLRGPGPRVAAGAAWEALAQAEARYSEVLVALRDRQPAYAQLVTGRPARWGDVARRLPVGTALVEYLVTDSAATAFVIRDNVVRAITLATDRATLAPLIEFARGAIAGQGIAAPSVRAPLQSLYEMLVSPLVVSGVLHGITRLVIVPQSELHYLPFAALLEPSNQGRYLVERYTISVVPSAAVWLQLQDRQGRQDGTRVLALAPETASLPGSAAEVAGIREVMGDGTTLLVGSSASREALQRGAPRHDIIHFATFGVLNRRNPLLSYLELAPGDGDGRLQVADVYGMSLRARLVVLSACQTGIGSGMLADVPAGDEWVSLSQAFLVAGGRQVLATLWPVEDQGTAALMTAFYRELAAGSDVDEALARAQRLAIRNSSRSAPFYWAGFVLIGGP